MKWSCHGMTLRYHVTMNVGTRHDMAASDMTYNHYNSLILNCIHESYGTCHGMSLHFLMMMIVGPRHGVALQIWIMQ
jgi:hypothetical protein